jgi:undecaprenyl-diphosphatase
LNRIDRLGYGGILLIGLAQVLALIPGTSRSGITITAARGLGFEREDAARISLLLSIPIILAAGGYQGLEVVQSGQLALGVDALIAAALAFVTALLAISWMMRWLRHASYTPFVIYRLLLGAGLLIWVYG